MPTPHACPCSPGSGGLLSLPPGCRVEEAGTLSELQAYKDWAKRHMSAMIARLQESERARREELQRVQAAASQLIKVRQQPVPSLKLQQEGQQVTRPLCVCATTKSPGLRSFRLCSGGTILLGTALSCRLAAE